MGVVPMINLLLYILCASGGVGGIWACLRLWACPLFALGYL